MIKKLILAILISLPTMAFAQKFGVVDYQNIMMDMPEIKEMQATIDASSKKYEEEYKNLTEKFQKEFTDFQALPEDTPQSIKDRRAQELQDLEQKSQQFLANAQQELQQQQQRLLAPIQERVRQAIETVGREGTFTFIFEKTQPLFTGTDAVDVTTQVRTKLGI